MSAEYRVDLDAFRRNLRRVREAVAPAAHMLVVKDDAYAHGLETLVRRAWDEGVRWFGAFDVATGAAVRAITGPDARIFVWLIGGVDDLRAGKPLDVMVKAALLTDKQNLELRLHTAPLPKSLVPTPERVMVKIQPVDLAPLGPFLPKDARLEAGRLDADWTAELGAAVTGGKGPTKAKGGIHARGLRFAGTGASPAMALAAERTK